LKYIKQIQSIIDSALAADLLRWGILVILTGIFSVVLYSNLAVKKPAYSLGDVAQKDVKAHRDFFVEDPAATGTNRQQAMDSVLTVYDFDSQMAAAISRQVLNAFAYARRETGALTPPPAPTKKPAPPTGADALNEQVSAPPSPKEVGKIRRRFEETLGIPVSWGAYKVLEEVHFSDNISQLINRILLKILANGVVTSKEILLKEKDKGIVLRDVETQKELIVQDLGRFYGLDQAKSLVRSVGQPLFENLDYSLISLVVDFVQRLIQPNITLNRNETQARKNKVAEEIQPVLYRIKSGEMILREGERINEMQLLKLKTLASETQKEQVAISSIGAAMLIMCLLWASFLLHIRPRRRIGRRPNKDLLFLACVFIVLFLLADMSSSVANLLSENSTYPISVATLLYGLPMAAGAMVICLFLGLEIAIPAALILALCFAIIFQNRLEMFVYFFTNSAMAAYWVRDCRERKVFVTAGLKIGLLNVFLVTAIALYLSNFSSASLLWGVAFAFLGGVGAGIVTAGIVPLIEMTFDYTTDITLLELANLDKPILRRFMIEAPGSYHHSVIVGSLVEAAAAQIGANPILAKVCGYYHDIGKIKKPLYFIENQQNGKNKHDKLAPSMSSLILIAHIKDGVEIARQHKLGDNIVDAIQQHHGTSLIRYFFEKAKQRKGEGDVKIDNYRYPGPKPQTREAGLVLLADVVEAASRTLDNPTPSRIQGLVQKLINTIFSDGQLDECELTLKDLHLIARSFNKMLCGIHHHRIEYSETRTAVDTSGRRSDRNAGSDRQPAKNTPDIDDKNKANGAGHLRRLGLSQR